MYLGEIFFGSILAIGSVTGLAGVIHFGTFARKVKPRLIQTAASRGAEVIERIHTLRQSAPDAPPRRHIERLRRQLASSGGLDAAFARGISFSADSANDAVVLYVAPYSKGLTVLGYWAAMSTICALAGTVSGAIAIFQAMSHDKTDLFSVIGGVGVCLRMTCAGMVVALISGAAVRIARHALTDLQTNVRFLVLAVHDAVVDSWPRQDRAHAATLPAVNQQQKQIDCKTPALPDQDGKQVNP